MEVPEAVAVSGWTATPNGLTHRSAEQETEQQAVFTQAGGIDQRRRSMLPTEAGHYDMLAYRPILQALLDRLPVPLAQATVVDLGCGPGRFAEYLLSAGIGRVYALDHNAHDLRTLVSSLAPAEEQRLITLHAAVTAPPPRGTVDAALAMEVLYTLPDPAEGYDALRRWLPSGGLALVSNCCAESYFVHALLNANWDQAVRIGRDGRFLHAIGTGAVDIHLFDAERGRREAERAGFRVIRQDGVSGAIALLLHGWRAAGEEISLARVEDLAALVGTLPGLGRLQVDLLEAV